MHMTVQIKNMTPGVKLGNAMAGATVSAGYLKELLEFSVAQGAKRSQLIAMANISLEDLQDPDNRLSFASYIALMRAGKQLCNDPALPLRLGAHTDFHKISVVGLICYSAANMMEAFHQLNRYGRLIAEFDIPRAAERFQLVPEGNQMWFEDTRTDPYDFIEMTEETWSRFVCENRRNFPDMPFVKAVHVPHLKPPHWESYERILEVPVVFGSARNALLIDPSWAMVELNQPNQYAFGVLSEHANNLLKSLEDAQTIRGKVEKLLIPVLHKGEFEMEAVARQLGLSRQTLYRRLKSEGIRFADLLDNLRHQLALHYLEGKKTSVNETAYLVGFSEPSAFSRAFKRWTGRSPSNLR
tara:strand:- start:212 stop:1276 length:1065 start_codon:yes stop_codon:yes gene_type:complete